MLIIAIESKDENTATHSINVAKYAKIIAKSLEYSDIDCELIYIGGLLHDIGKIGIKDDILNKPSCLTEEEFSLVKQHPTIGFNMLKQFETFQKDKILDMVLYHHERYDGKGYPKNLKADEIPQSVAIITLADAYDAMTSNRIYRDKYNYTHAINQIIENSGSQFDPVVAK